MKTFQFPISVAFCLAICGLTACQKHKDCHDDGDSAGVGLTMDVEKIEPMFDLRAYPGVFVRSAFAVKFACGTIPHGSPNPQNPPPGAPLVPGTYATAINILNPNRRPLVLRKWAVQTLPQGRPRGKISEWMTDTLLAGQGMEIDCDNIRELLQFPASQVPFVKGFVRLEFQSLGGRSEFQPEVVAVYTAKNVLQDTTRTPPAEREQ